MRIVQKFGGTSVADIQKIKSIAQKIKMQWDQGIEVIGVVSAMAGVTNQLVRYVTEISASYHPSSDHDAIFASGEQVSSGLLALALQGLGVPAQSMLAWQIPIKTDENPTNSTILDISSETLEHLLSQRIVPIVAGFQGISPSGRLTTLGRGGSDTTAVALAAFCGASRCDIYTDVEGVYTADPRLVPQAVKLDQISYDHMLKLSQRGAKVLQEQSVAFAQKHKVPVQVLSSFTESPGTLMDENRSSTALVTSIAHKVGLCSILLQDNQNVKDLTPIHSCKTKEGQIITFPLSDKEKMRHDLSNPSHTLMDSTGLLTLVGHQHLISYRPLINTLLKSLEIPLIGFEEDRDSLTFLMPQHHIESALKVLHEELILKFDDDKVQAERMGTL